jgi:putative transposase
MSRWEPEERLESLLRTLTLVVRKKSVRSVSSSRVSDFRSCDPGRSCALQQLREALPGDAPFHFLIHDRNRIFSLELDKAVAAMGVRVLPTPLRAPQANARCERVVGTIRRECLDFLIPLGQRHLKHLLNRWVEHYNHGRVHMSLGPGIPSPLTPSPPYSEHRHRLPPGHRVCRKAVLGGLHHEYWLENIAA